MSLTQKLIKEMYNNNNFKETLKEKVINENIDSFNNDGIKNFNENSNLLTEYKILILEAKMEYSNILESALLQESLDIRQNIFKESDEPNQEHEEKKKGFFGKLKDSLSNLGNKFLNIFRSSISYIENNKSKAYDGLKNIK